jgi:hypothetical protein
VWERGGGGLGKTPRTIWETLLREGDDDVWSLAEKVGHGRDAVLKGLAKLVSCDLVKPTWWVTNHEDHGSTVEGRWHAIPATSERLDEIAEQLGTAGRGSRRRIRYKNDRSIYKGVLASRSA